MYSTKPLNEDRIREIVREELRGVIAKRRLKQSAIITPLTPKQDQIRAKREHEARLERILSYDPTE